MPIDGSPTPESYLVPVIRNGKETLVHKRLLQPYDLETAQKEAEGARNPIYRPGNKDDAQMLKFTIERIQALIRGADETIATCRSELDNLHAKRDRLNSKEAATRYDRAIIELKTNMDRHSRLRSRLVESLRRVRTALADCRNPQRPTLTDTNP